jgi:polyribonucleotide nucleotidyltransferase
VAVVDEVRAALGRHEQDIVRGDALAGRRIGGRGPADIRPIAGRVGWLKRCHGSSLFTRGETQAVVTCTLGGERDARSTETLDGQQLDRFLLHYNFPPYSVGEVRPMRGPGRREVGHGNLARRALLGVLPPPAELPYTVRLESLITSSNGSSSMATVCGATLALHDAGIALKRPVAGIAMGLVQDGDRFVVLSDILGDEDHVGDMDFKVCGTSAGITAIQLDNKLGSLDTEVMRLALDQARQGRLHILERMAAILPAARPELSPHAPRTLSLAVEPNRVGGLIGSGGRTIKGLQSDLGVSIDVGDDGQVRVSARDQAALARAADRIRDLCDVPRVGEVYQGVVVGVQPFGAFVRLFEGVEGLVADPSLGANARLKVRVTGVNNRGRLVLERA